MKRLVPDPVVLGLIKKQPSHGYELLEQFNSNEHLGRIWTMSTSQLYAVLKRLEKQETIIGKEVIVPDAPPRREYVITDEGERQLHNWLWEPNPSTSIHRIRVMFLSRIFIATILDLPTKRIVDAQKSMCLTQQEKLTTISEQSYSVYEKFALDFVVGQLKSAIAWLDSLNLQINDLNNDKYKSFKNI